MNDTKVRLVLCRGRGFLFLLLVLQALSCKAFAALTVTPTTWNVIGLDSNTPASGPKIFPVGVQVCSDIAANNVDVDFIWDSANAYVNLRAGSANPVTIPSISAGGCAEAFFEVEVTADAAAYDTSRRYHITAGGVSTPTPRELYVERLVSQNRNYITDIKLNGASIPAGSNLNVVVGNTYTIELKGGTATQGYNQFEMFLNFPNTAFQVLSVSTTYSADDSPYVSNPNNKIYGDSCQWENDPNSPNYRSCTGGDYKVGGSNVVTTYSVKVIGGGGTTSTLNTLIYDFSGSSYHYNADYTSGARIVKVYSPASVTINKAFSPKTISPNNTSVMTIKLNNTTPETVTGVNFTDSFPAGAAVASVPNVTYNGCGAGAFSPALSGGETSISFSGGTITANSICTITVDVTSGSVGTYNNTTGNLFINTSVDTGNTGSDSLIVSTAPAPPSSCGSPATMATWTMPTSGQGSGGPPPPYTTKATDVSTATASSSPTGTFAISTAQGNPVNSWSGSGWPSSGTITPPGAATEPYYDFVIDTSKYGGLQITVGYYMPNADWASVGNNFVYAYTKADSGSFDAGTGFSATKGSWQSITYTASSTGTSTTTIRISAAGAKTTPSPGVLYIDNITITGCVRPDPPTITKSFSATSIALNGTTTLTFTITNPNSGASLSGVAFSDVLPSGLTVSDSSTAQCGGTLTTTAATRTISLSGGSLAASANCNFGVTVTGAAAGQYQNVSGNVTATESGSNTTGTGYATASLTVIAPPSLTKSFSPSSIFTGTTSTLTFTITNPNTASSLSGMGFTDTLPAGLTVPTSGPTAACGGSVSTTNPDSISFSGGTLAANSTCNFSVTVTGATAGTKNNTTSAITSTEGGNGNTASNSLVVNNLTPSIDLTKEVSTNPAGPWYKYVAVAPGSSVYYRFKVYNSGDTALYTIGITETVGSINPSCSWPEPLAAGDTAYCVSGAVTAVAGSNLNTAYAHGKYPSGGAVYNSATSSATYATTGLTFAKSVTETYFTGAGDVLNYSYVVTNSGFATLAGPVTVSDDKSTNESCPSLTTVGDFDSYMDPSEQITCTATYTVVAADVTAKLVTNTASATVSGVTSPSDAETVPLASDLTVTKSNDSNGVVGVSGSFVWTLTVKNSTAAGSSAAFADTQTLLTDDLPNSGATYVAGAVKKSGVSGAINCSIAADTLTCTASGTVTIPPALQGTVSVTSGNATVTGTGTSFTSQLAAGSIIVISGVSYTVSSIQNDTQLTLSVPYAGGTDTGLSIPGSFSIPVTVTATAGGALANPRSGGICRADPGGVVPEMSNANNDCSDTVTAIQSPPTISMSFTPNSVSVNGTSVLTITITNTDSGGSLTNVALTNNYPTNLVNTAAPSGATTCTGGSVTAVAGGSSVSLSGATIPASGSCNITVNVTSATTGSYNNTIPVNTLTCTEGKTNVTAASATLTVTAMPDLVLVKSVLTQSDPVNDTTNPKAIPGAVMLYTITLTNTGAGTADTIVLTDAIPSNLEFFAGDINGAGSGPFLFQDGAVASGLSYSFISLASGADSPAFSNDGATYTYTPVPDGNGYDSNVTNIKISLTGTFNGASGGNNPSFSVKFKVRVK